MMPWLRLWNEMPTDPKWRTIAHKCGQPVASVVAVFTLMMTNANANSKDRGSLENWADEDAAAALDLDEDAVKSIREAMQGKVLNDKRLTGWEKRQPLREDDSAKRVREHRQRKASNAPQRNVTPRNAPDSDTDSDTDSESEYGFATKEEFILAVDWKVPPIEELPFHVQERVLQWPPGQYDREAENFAIMGGERKTEEQWCEAWNDHILARHRCIMKAASATDRIVAGEKPSWQQRADERN